jgi:glucose/arabinose dehydrogenase
LIVHEGVSDARHIAVSDDGDLYVARQRRPEGESGNGIVALRDTTGDGRADVVEEFGELRGSGIALIGPHLYFATDTSIVRYALPADGGLSPQGAAELVVQGLPPQRTHASKSLAFDGTGGLWVGIGAPSNNCGGSTDRQAGARGQNPCPELERQAGVWRFDANRLGQTQADGERWASGIRNTVALAYHPTDGSVWTVQHGRDQLDLVSSGRYTAEDNAQRPAEELLRLERGTAYSWPYCFFDLETSSRMVAPEYENTDWADRCDTFPEPVAVYGAHWAPNDLLFYTGTQFPERFHGGAFIAFHGSWNRAPLPQAGYNVVFQPLSGAGSASGEYEIFVDGFSGDAELDSPGSARYRPMGLAQGPDGTLYIADSVAGRIWRVWYAGE